jgi:hypothetical protein
MVNGRDWDDDFEPPHQLLLDVPGGEAGRPVTFVQGPGSGDVTREWAERQVIVPEWVADVLGLRAGDPAVKRTMRLFVGQEPVLMSTSYVPVGLAEDDEGWREAEVGQLALTGSAARPIRFEERSRMPTPAEAELLNLPEEVPVLVLCHPYEVLTDPEASVPAGVLVVARGDRVYLRFRA